MHLKDRAVKLQIVCSFQAFCSELILWRIDPVGPLSKSGGISELARINSKEISAFTDVAWLPTLLPSSVLGSVGNSPSACFVASDGHCLRVYQAVIDARMLLAELNISPASIASSAAKYGNALQRSTISDISSNSSINLEAAGKLNDKFKIVSSQSTAKPGAVIELEAIEHASQVSSFWCSNSNSNLCYFGSYEHVSAF